MGNVGTDMNPGPMCEWPHCSQDTSVYQCLRGQDTWGKLQKDQVTLADERLGQLACRIKSNGRF